MRENLFTFNLNANFEVNTCNFIARRLFDYSLQNKYRSVHTNTVSRHIVRVRAVNLKT